MTDTTSTFTSLIEKGHASQDAHEWKGSFLEYL